MNSTNLNIVSQNQAFENIKNKLEDIVKTDMLWDNIISLSGAAGTGKTYLTSKLIEQLKNDYHITITAPTHKALQVLRKNLISTDGKKVETKTLQSFLNIRLVTNYDNGKQKFEPLKISSKDQDKTKTDILIIDESSMVSSDLFSYIINSIEENRVKAVLFVGDEYQLLPVDNFDNKVFDIKTKYKLDKIVRQAKDSYIINIATKARNIIKSKNYISIAEFLEDDSFCSNIEFFTQEDEFHKDFCTPDTWSQEDKVIASFKNDSVDKHNKIIRQKYWEAQDITKIPTLLKGDKVIFQQANIIDNKPVHQNSDIVKLSSAKATYHEKLKFNFWDCKDLNNKPFKVIDPNSKMRFDNTMDQIAKLAKNEKDYKKRIQLWKTFYHIKETFIDVKYTYASTIHKLQGSTYDTVYIDLRDIEYMNDKDMMYRLLYVAITRASKNIKILLSNSMSDSLAHYQNNILDTISNSLDELGIDL